MYRDLQGKGWCFPTWITLHAIGDSYPEEPNETDKKLIHQLLESLSWILPCETCNEHFREQLKTHPIQDQSRLALMTWLVDFQNRVNVRLGKPELTFEEAIEKQQEFRYTDWAALITRSKSRDCVIKAQYLPLILGLGVMALIYLNKKR